MEISLAPTQAEAAYVKAVVDGLKNLVPEVTPDQLRDTAYRTLNLYRRCDVIRHFREQNYGRMDNVLDAEFVD